MYSAHSRYAYSDFCAETEKKAVQNSSATLCNESTIDVNEEAACVSVYISAKVSTAYSLYQLHCTSVI